MPDFKHSPGFVWTYCRDTSCGPCGNIYAGPKRLVGQAFGQAHAVQIGDNPKLFAGPDEQMANLRLMAASPFMLLVLQQIAGFRDDISMAEAKALARRAVQKAIVGAQELQS